MGGESEHASESGHISLASTKQQPIMSGRRQSVTVSPVPISNQGMSTSPLSTSPNAPAGQHFGSFPNGSTSPTGIDGRARGFSSGGAFAFPGRPQQGRALKPFPRDEVTTKVLLLENVNQSAVDILERDPQGFEIVRMTKALGEEELIKTLKEGQFTALGIRSKTRVTARVISQVPSLLVIGCFCIGTNQVDLIAAAKAGIAVFNSPFSNSRSVAELVISEIVALSRQLCDRSREMREGIWNKVSKGCWEVRGKTLGIVGYGHIGSQLSVLAEAMGMSVLYYDVLPIMPLGSARQIDTLDELLGACDFVSLHVPELQETTGLIGAEQLAAMRDGAYLINNARGKVVNIPELAKALQSGKLAGAAIDVYPAEPASNGPFFGDDLNEWATELRACPNLILTPHIGGSTEEAQRMIGVEVGSALVRYLNMGATIGAVNFPEVSLRPIIESDRGAMVRLCHVHQNQPGVLKLVNTILGDYNVEKQFSDSDTPSGIAYLLADIAVEGDGEIKTIFDSISATSSNVLTRILY